jgi:phosphoserine phosphatase
MNSVVTLISDPAMKRIMPEAAEAARQALVQAGAAPGGIDWLCPELACDIPFEATPAIDADAAVRGAIGGAPVDVVVQATQGRRKRLLIADMESTMIQNEMVDELARLVGVGDKVAEITHRAMNGEIEFRPALRERAALLGGLEASLLKQMRETIVFTPGAHALVRTMKAHGAKTALVSGGFKVYSKWVKKRLGFDKHFANDLIVRDGIVTGELAEPVLGREAKLEALDKMAAKHGLSRDDALAIGDGANDLMIIAAAGTGVAFHAKPSVAAQATARINHGDLTAALYVQGYRRSEFVEDG